MIGRKIEHPLPVMGVWEIIFKENQSEKKQSLGILFGEALFTHLRKHLGGRPVPKHAQLKKVDYPVRDCGSRRKDRRKRYIWTCLIFVRNMVKHGGTNIP